MFGEPFTVIKSIPSVCTIQAFLISPPVLSLKFMIECQNLKKKKLVEVNFIKCPILIATGTLKMQVLK